MLERMGGRRRRGRQRMRWLDGITDSRAWVWVNSRSWWWTGRPGVLRFMGSQWVGPDRVAELNWTRELSEVLVRSHRGMGPSPEVPLVTFLRPGKWLWVPTLPWFWEEPIRWVLWEAEPLKVEPQRWYLSLTKSLSEVQQLCHLPGTPGRWAFGSCDSFCP